VSEARAALPVQDPDTNDQDLVGDRPDFTEHVKTVPRGRFQLETGITTERQDRSNQTAWPEALLRWGVGRTTELRFGLPQTEELALGVKQRLIQELRGFSLTTIGTATRSEGGETEPELVLTWEHSVLDPVTIAGQFAWIWTDIEGRRRSGGLATLALGRPFKDSLATFLEYALDVVQDRPPIHQLHHGYVWQAVNRIQFDVHGGVGLSGAAPDFFIGFGMIARLNGGDWFPVRPSTSDGREAIWRKNDIFPRSR
jgi:hypothetical protein